MEAEVTKELMNGPGEILEQRTIFGPDGKRMKASDGIGRRVDQVRVENNKVTEVFETTSPTEAKRSKKQGQINRGNEMISTGDAYIKDKQGNLLPINPNIRTQVKTKK